MIDGLGVLRALRARSATCSVRGVVRNVMSPALRAVVLVLAALAASCAEDPDVLCDGTKSCELRCPDGFCNFYCDGRAECVGSCEGGECTLVCTDDTSCELTCPTGDCALFCRDDASCSCDGCRTSCDPSATCD